VFILKTCHYWGTFWRLYLIILDRKTDRHRHTEKRERKNKRNMLEEIKGRKKEIR
jgi:hypothetical protein